MRNMHSSILLAAGLTLAASATTAAGQTPPTQLLGVEFRDGLFTGNNARLFDVDPITGAATNPRSTGADVLTGITQGPGGTLFALTDALGMVNGQSAANSLLTIDLASGATSVVGAAGLTLSEGDLDFNPLTGELAGVSTENGVVSIFGLDPATGVASNVQTLDMQGDGSGLAFADDGSLYLLDTTVNASPTEAFLRRVDLATGSILETVTIPLGLGTVAGIDFDETGTLFLADGDFNGTEALYTIELATGTPTLVGETVTTAVFGGLSGLEFATIPEPGTIGLAAIAIGLGRRRRR